MFIIAEVMNIKITYSPEKDKKYAAAMWKVDFGLYNLLSASANASPIRLRNKPIMQASKGLISIEVVLTRVSRSYTIASRRSLQYP